MAILLASFAFVLSLVALWFASELARRTDGGAKIAVKPHLAAFNQALIRAEADIRDLSRELELAQREIKILRADQASVKESTQGGGAATPNGMPAPSPVLPHAMDNAAAFTPSARYNA